MATTPPELEVQSVDFAPIEPEDNGHPLLDLSLLYDLALQVRVELGRTRVPVKDILAIGPGAVLELQKMAGEPVEVYVNDRLMARGEVVVVDEHFGVRVIEIIKPRG